MRTFVFDQVITKREAIFSPFAATDVFTELVGEEVPLVLHFWQLEATLILGMKDTRVTHLLPALERVKQLNYYPIVRNAGGLGVISDKGVLNISLIFKKTEQLSSTDEAYKKMYHLTQQAFPELAIDALEIADSYCPGTFDLSVAGRKIAGIAQRRVKDGIAVMMYLSVNGNQIKRGELVKQFYQTGLEENFGMDGYPAVNPESMVTLSELLGYTLSMDDVKKRFLTLLTPNEPILDLIQWLTTQNQFELYQKKEQNMIERNQRIKELLYVNSL